MYRDQRLPLDHAIELTFPIIQPLLIQLIDNNHIEAAHILRLCFKIFFSYTMYTLPQPNSLAASIVDVNLWFDILGRVFKKPLHEASQNIEPIGQPIDIDERRKWPWWKVKKWVGRIMTYFIQRYGNPRYCNTDHIEFANYFRSHSAITWLLCIFDVLDSKVTHGFYLTDDVYRSAISYVSNCCEMSPTYKVVKPHLNFLLFQIVYPTLCLTQREIQLFHDDPAEFNRLVNLFRIYHRNN